MAEKILVVDDEKDITELINYFLSKEGYDIICAYNATDALKLINSTPFDLAILDIMLPDESGFSLCKKIRERFQYPVIMLTAKVDAIDKVTGLTIGADDYITKPFLPLELVARVKAQLRRYKEYNTPTDNAPHKTIIHSGLIMDLDTQECTLGEKPLSLTRTEFAILRILCEHKGSVVSAETLFKEIWGEEYFNKNNNTIAVHIRRLREKMNIHLEGRDFIKTVWGRGYKID
ncbi:MAG: response regulator transcription factor [Peptococcaceae bacterium]|nr:response regulator transcription factor [Peptococcaceae bacterium]